MAVSNADAPDCADHLSQQLQDVGEGEVGDVDVVGAGVQVVQQSAQCDRQVAMS